MKSMLLALVVLTFHAAAFAHGYKIEKMVCQEGDVKAEFPFHVGDKVTAEQMYVRLGRHLVADNKNGGFQEWYSSDLSEANDPCTKDTVFYIEYSAYGQ